MGIIVWDNYQLYSMALSSFVHRFDYQLAGVAASVEDIFRLLSCKKVDMALLGVNLPDTGYADVVRRIRSDYPAVKILANANEGTAEIINAMMDAGMNGYIGKRQTNEHTFLEAIEKVMNGERYIGRVDEK